MKLKLKVFLSGLLFFTAFFMWGQSTKTVNGTVTDADGIALPGVNVIIKGTAIGGVTDFDGKYSVKADDTSVIVFSYLGYETVEILAIGRTTIDVQLVEDAESLNEVVVTAQGIKREKKALGYAVTTVEKEALEGRPEADIGRVLSGKVAGVNVVGTGGVAGSGTNISIRGNVSITGNNQPLFVVNGIPFNSSTNDGSDVSTGQTSVSASSRFLDIDPNSITSINVLKGLSATTLYGDAGRNGVILVTTKTGSTDLVNKKFEITLNQSTFVTKIANLPDYQNTYGQGADNAPNIAFVGNWGGRFEDGFTVNHHYNQPRLALAFPEFQGVTQEYRAFEDNVKDFFRTGFGTTTSVNASKSSEDVSYNINFGHTDEDGFIPGNNVTRTNFGLGGAIKLSNNFKVNGSFNFSTSRFIAPPISANNGTNNFSVFTRTLFIPRNLDLNGLPFQNPIDGSSVYYRTDQENPLWLVNNSQESNDVNRFYNSISTTYDFNKYLSATYRVGLDTYTENQQFYINRGGVSSVEASGGYLRTTAATNTIWDHSLIMNVKDVKLGKSIGLNSIIGLNTNSETFERFGVVSTGQIVFDFIDHNNFTTQSNTDPLAPTINLDRNITVSTVGLYGQFQFDYDNYLYLTLSGRNDWSSTIERDNRSLFYPSASLSFIPTTAIPDVKSETLNYLKLRFGYGTSAGFPGAFNVRPVVGIGTNQFGDFITNSNDNVLPNADLEAELHREFELGIETKLFNNIVDLEVSAYKRFSDDQILNKSLDASTGFTSTFINAGSIESEGVEVDLGITPFRNKGEFQWESRLNYSATQNEVIDLPEGEQVFIAGFSNLGNYAIEGQPLGVIRGSYAVRDDEGNLLIDPNTGNVINSNTIGLEDEVIGDPNPDWKMTSINTFSYKGFSLSAQVEYTHGGDISSNTINNLLRRGVTKDTESREGTFVLAGVLADPITGEALLDASGNKIQNTIQQGANEVFFLNAVDPGQQGVYDASVWRLREVSLTYDFPSKFLDKTPFGSFSLSVRGQNLWFWAPNVPEYTNFDPEVISTGVGNGLGLDFQTAPTSKKIAVGVRATF